MFKLKDNDVVSVKKTFLKHCIIKSASKVLKVIRMFFITTKIQSFAVDN